MSEEIELDGIKVPAADLEATPESIKLVLEFLVEERKQTLAKIEALEERINKNSKNSSIPPSKNGFGGKVSHKVTAKRKPFKLQSQAAATTEAMEFTKQQPVVNCDETGFSQQNKDGENPSQKKAWLWVIVTPLVSVFMVTLSRSQDIAKELIGESFLGYLGSDRYSSYGWVKTDLRQLCWSHLLRDFQAISERSGVSQEIGLALLARGYRLFHWWHRVRDGTLERELFVEAVTLLRVGFHQELLSAAAIEIGSKETTPLAKTVRTCRKLLQVEAALWTFVYHESIEPTNNSAERALRSAVIWRNLSFGSQSSEGSNFVARMLTVNCSLKAQGRSILDFLTESCLAHRLGLTTPSLIPMTQDEDVSAPLSKTLILS